MGSKIWGPPIPRKPDIHPTVFYVIKAVNPKPLNPKPEITRGLRRANNQEGKAEQV